MGEPPSHVQEDDLLMEEEELEGDETVPPQLPAASGPVGSPPAVAGSPSLAITPTEVTVASPAVNGGASVAAPVPVAPDRIPLPPTAGGLPPLPPVPRVIAESPVPATPDLAGTRAPTRPPTPASGSGGDAMSFASTAARPVPASVTPGAVDRPSPMMVDRSGDAPVGGRGLLLPRRPLGIPPTTGTTASSPSPADAAGVPTGARLPGPASEAPLTRRAVAPTGAASAWMPVPETQVVPLADLVAQVRLLPLPVPVGEGGTLEVGPIPDESDSTGVSPSGPSYGVSRVELDPSWRSELERVIARPSDVRVEFPAKIVVNNPMFRDVFDCESYSLVNKSLTYGSREAHTLGRRKKDVAQSFGVRSEWDGTPPLKVFQFLRKFAKACDDNDVSEAEAFFMLQDFTKEPLRSEVMSVMPSRHGGNPGEVNSYLELINWMLRYHADEASLAAQVEEFNRATQTPGESERTFAERLRQLNVLCGFIHPQGVIKGRFVEGVHRAARVTVRERNTPSMTLAELARIAQTKGDEYRWIVSDQRREREKEARIAEASRLRRPTRPPPYSRAHPAVAAASCDEVGDTFLEEPNYSMLRNAVGMWGGVAPVL
ncbi:hypothetical protein MMPV_000838 [Pyropia vietnamensis]